uniref:Uncharacterized protein n=1 Tax=Haemonchus placei TaxID=6290 RepID=A0A0N4W2J8_HAEPC
LVIDRSLIPTYFRFGRRRSFTHSNATENASPRIKAFFMCPSITIIASYPVSEYI